MKQLVKYVLITVAASLIHYFAFTQVKRVDAIAITVKEMDRSIKFYSEVLGFSKVSDRELAGESFEKLEGLFGLRMRVVRMQLGSEYIELVDYLTAGGRPIPADARSNDLSFQHIAIVVSDMDKAYARLKQFGVEHVSTSPQTLPPSIPEAAGVKAFYFHDPDNHNLELIYFPKGKGQEKWQHPGGKIFMGIDHTAVAVSNTAKSLQFYCDLLGIEPKGESWNKGKEQEHLNNVEGASLHITGLRSLKGPGIEFLQYLQPGPGKPYPSDSRMDDLWSWQTIVIVDDLPGIYNKLISSGYSIVSKEVKLESKGYNKNTGSFVVRDPDGHALKLVGEMDPASGSIPALK